MRAPSSKKLEEWKELATKKKSHLQKKLHRELSYSGIINEEISYSTISLAILGIEN